jgi:two-component system NarL family response regulator
VSLPTVGPWWRLAEEQWSKVKSFLLSGKSHLLAVHRALADDRKEMEAMLSSWLRTGATLANKLPDVGEREDVQQQGDTMSYLDPAQESDQLFIESTASPLPGPLTVLIVDDHALVRSAIGQVLAAQSEIEHIIMARNYADAEEQTAQLHPDIIWLDLHVAHVDSSAEIDRLKKLSPASRIIALADVEDEREALAAIMAGAHGYRSKQDVHQDEIMPIIRGLCRNELVLCPKLVMPLIRRLREAALPLWEAESGWNRHPFS